MIITIDGPAGAGKSTVARIVARRLGLPYLNSGFIYRAVTLLVLERAAAEGCAIEEMFERRDDILEMIGDLELTFRDEAPSGEGDSGRTLVFIGEREISGSLKSSEVTSNIWRVADDGEYRGGLLGLQRSCARETGVVAEGRDMGSVVFRDADLKFYLDASSEERARRRFRERDGTGDSSTYEEIREAIESRDSRDRNRVDSPLIEPEGAIRVCTDDWTVEQTIDFLVGEVEKKRSP
tara:strand:- start:1042 stop:1752 length:711 start_codon:yes stop_codon:yes gene_type:complete